MLKPRCRSNSREISFSHRHVYIWNSLDDGIIACDSINSFKNRRDTFLHWSRVYMSLSLSFLPFVQQINYTAKWNFKFERWRRSLEQLLIWIARGHPEQISDPHSWTGTSPSLQGCWYNRIFRGDPYEVRSLTAPQICIMLQSHRHWATNARLLMTQIALSGLSPTVTMQDVIPSIVNRQMGVLNPFASAAALPIREMTFGGTTFCDSWVLLTLANCILQYNHSHVTF